MIFSNDERILKPLVNIEISHHGSDHYDEEHKDMHSHKIKDEIERIDVENYLNIGEGNYLDDNASRKSLTSY